MSVEIYKQIFDLFFTTKPVGKVTGMDMSIRNQIIIQTITQKHNGKLNCVSTSEKEQNLLFKFPFINKDVPLERL